MAGHSKWKNIQRTKTVSDLKKSKIFTKISKLITLSAQLGQDPRTNSKLLSAIEKAKQFNVPKDLIERAINKGKDKQENLKEYIYEGIFQKNYLLLIECITDNKNRCYTEVKNILHKNSGKIIEPGLVSAKFRKLLKVQIYKNLNQYNISKLLEKLIEENLIEDIKENNQLFVIYCDINNKNMIIENLETKNIKIESIDLCYIPLEYLPISEEQKVILAKILQDLENIEDVQNVWTNALI